MEMEPANILVIEDDDIVARTIERSLRGEEFRVDLASSGVEGLKVARRNRPDLIILDVIMPGMDGFAVCREIRADPVLTNIPVLFLTAKIKDEDKIAGFNVGADDYLCKPFNIDELMLRVRAILRRTRRLTAAASQPGAAVKVGEYVLDTSTYELNTPHRGKVRLTPVQYDLLYHLMSHPGQIYSPMKLLNEVWDYPTDTGSPDLVRVHVKNLRELVELDPRSPVFIRTVPGYGYTVSTESV
jgi:two-component system response regulator RpaA